MTSIDTKRNKWHEGLKRCGTYYEGFIDGEKVAECLEIDRRDTASTFGTSRHVTCSSSQTTENVSCISIYKSWRLYLIKKIQDDPNTPRPASQNTSLY